MKTVKFTRKSTTGNKLANDHARAEEEKKTIAEHQISESNFFQHQVYQPQTAETNDNLPDIMGPDLKTNIQRSTEIYQPQTAETSHNNLPDIMGTDQTTNIQRSTDSYQEIVKDIGFRSD